MRRIGWGRHLGVLHGGGDDLLTVRAVAGRLGLSTASVYRLCEDGEIPHIRISNAIRVDPVDLAALIDALKRGGR